MTTKTPFDTLFSLDNPAFEDARKAQSILIEAVEKTARQNLEATTKLLDMTRERISGFGDLSDPAQFTAGQSDTVKEYSEHLKAHLEALNEIGRTSREELSEVGADMIKNVDFGPYFAFAEGATSKPRKAAAKSKSA